MKPIFFQRLDCRLCRSSRVENVVPLAPMPIATPNFRVPDAERNDPVFRTAVPLDLFLCRDCGHLQVMHVGNPEIQYRHYVYTTGLSLGLREHFAKYADEVIDSVALAPGSFVLELGSNDGSLLRVFKERGMRVLGVDPAVDIAREASANGIETIGEFFDDRLAAEIRRSHGAADVVIANNVIANIDDMEAWAAGVRDVLAPGGVFVFETQYGVDVMEKNLLDTVYHEHLSYFNVKPMQQFFARLGMELIDVRNIWTKGGSIRTTVQLAGGPRKPSPAVARFVEEEERLGVDKPAYYSNLSRRIAAVRDELSTLADRYHTAGRLVAGYGVSVGTTTLLPQFDLTQRIDFLVDDDPNKGDVLFGPGYDIPILPPEALYDRKPAAVIVFAWRYTDPIVAKHGRYLAEGGEFVVPLPEVTFRRG